MTTTTMMMMKVIWFYDRLNKILRLYEQNRYPFVKNVAEVKNILFQFKKAN